MTIFATAMLLVAQVAGSSVADWQWDADSPICALRQQNEQGQSIEIKRTPANEELQLDLKVRSRPDIRGGHSDAVSIDLQPSGQFVASVSFARQGKKLSIHMGTQDPEAIKQLSNASGLSISNRTNEPVRIALQSAGVAIEASRACEDRKMRAWGIDPVAWRALKSRPIPIGDPRENFTYLDYPEDALRAHVEFDAIIRLDVATDGNVERCRGLNPGTYKGFETASCAVLKRARFRPATDARNNPVSAPIVYDVVFRIAS
jgi:TonB family protein